MRRGYVDTTDGQMHYRESGSGRPLVLIHQALRSSLEYRLVAPLLADRYRVISVDLMGYGDSDKPPVPYAITEHVAALKQVTDALGLGRFALGGHHTGGNVALEFAATHPDDVEALVLSGPAVVIGTEERDALVAKMSAVEYPDTRVDGSHLLPIWKESLVSSFGVPRLRDDDPELLADFFIELIKVGPRRKEAHIAAFSHDALAWAPKVTAPTLVMVGVEDMWACARGAEIHAVLPDSELREFDMAGEMPRLEPVVFADNVGGFLDAHAPTAART